MKIITVARNLSNLKQDGGPMAFDPHVTITDYFNSDTVPLKMTWYLCSLLFTFQSV